MLIFPSDMNSGVLHGISSIAPDSCPSHLQHVLNDSRICLQFREEVKVDAVCQLDSTKCHCLNNYHILQPTFPDNPKEEVAPPPRLIIHDEEDISQLEVFNMVIGQAFHINYY